MQSQPPTLLCSYSYDPLDRLTSHTLPESAERQRFHCKNRLTTEIQGAIKHSIVQHDDLLLAHQRVEDKALDTTLLATDQQRSVLRTLKADHLPQPIAYSPYGHRDPENGLLSLLGFNGERPDPVTGHYLLGDYRAFNPALMRFNSPDSMSPFEKGGVNHYAYCQGDPINRADPNGHFSFFTWVKASWTRKLAYQDGFLNIAPTASVSGAMKARGRLNKLDSLILSERGKKYRMRSGKLDDDWAQLQMKNRTSSLSVEELKAYHIHRAVLNDSNRYFRLERLNKNHQDLPAHLNKLTNNINRTSNIHSILNHTRPTKVTPEDLATHLKNDIAQLHKEVKEIRNPALTELKKERSTLYNKYFLND